MRTILVTGPGGAGCTTVAAATALGGARRGQRVLFLTGERAVPDGWFDGGDRPVVRRIDSGARFRDEFLAVQERATTALGLLGATPLAGEELTELPGSDRFALLSALREAAAEDWDLVVADMPPVLDAVAVLALPEQLRRYLRRLLPPERQAARALRPMLAQLAGVPMPAEWLYGAVARKDAELAAVQAVIEDPATTVRLVAEPGPAAARTLRTARAGLALYRLATEPAVANRMLPTESPDPWLAGLAAQQQTHVKAMGEAHELPHLGHEPRTAEDLTRLEPPAAPPAPAPDWTVEDRREPDGVLVWRIALPGAAKPDLGLVRRGDELVLTTGPFRRVVPLPSALRRCTVSGAALDDGALSVRFVPDPDLWPRTR
ncbi:ArsA family ATPase [Streptomyces gobitricini]|uniref:ArsA-related P-loop ATPase n=1 Tax=Streptomyces gobitricini TaxID=68211 RepID=A0ABP5Z3I0_9ACTN